MKQIHAFSLFLLCIARQVFAQDEIDLSAPSVEKAYPYYDPFVRHPVYLILPLGILLMIALHLIKSTKRKPTSGRKPDVFFYPESEKSHEIKK